MSGNNSGKKKFLIAKKNLLFLRGLLDRIPVGTIAGERNMMTFDSALEEKATEYTEEVKKKIEEVKALPTEMRAEKVKEINAKIDKDAEKKIEISAERNALDFVLTCLKNLFEGDEKQKKQNDLIDPKDRREFRRAYLECFDALDGATLEEKKPKK